MMTKLDKYLNEILNGLSSECVALECPVAYFNGEMVLFAECNNYVDGHIFGGELPKIQNEPSGSVLHAVLKIDTSLCNLFREIEQSAIPLVFPFQHDGSHIKYTITGNNYIEINELLPEQADKDWPCRNYPQKFPVKKFCSSKPISISREGFEKILPQGLWKEDSNEIVVVVPPSGEYGVSIWGQEGDAEGVLCVFYINCKTGVIRAVNQCG